MTKDIAKWLIIAQASSDIAKNIRYLYDRIPTYIRQNAKWGYLSKDIAIYKLLQSLAENPRKDVRFYIREDKEKDADYIVYFDFMIDDSKAQMSFHSCDKRLKKFVAGSNRFETERNMEYISRSVGFALAKKYSLLLPQAPWNRNTGGHSKQRAVGGG